MEMKKCFGLKPHEEYMTKLNECYVLAWDKGRKMIKEGKCCTMECPFYKPNRADLRLGDKIYNRKGELKYGESIRR